MGARSGNWDTQNYHGRFSSTNYYRCVCAATVVYSESRNLARVQTRWRSNDNESSGPPPKQSLQIE